ncbi:hypothetical protein [Fluviicola chungangensis]|uniref:DUF3108 domain-containing protein n=1 Tax=Fluviicola chungangensis TaxID=2597671 RepID=A0A556N6Q6_9FLAO|nr:hypothetical protein [Fluviicola chungangensis]TSJ47818.1 hypothetical protein FO442_01435 [Fluviicola chungangensis]
MKKLALYSIFTLFVGFGVKAQDCETLVKDCEKILKGKEQNFVSDGQVYTAFLDREKAEFKTTFFGGTTYRIAATAGTDDEYVIFTVKDLQGTVLFSNRKYKNSSYWDFKVPRTIPVIIETELDMDKKITGCAVMMIGFKR